VTDDPRHPDHAEEAQQLSRAERRRQAARRLTYEEPQEGLPIFRPVERAVLVAVQTDELTRSNVDAGLDELAALCDTAGSEVVGRVVQRRAHPDPATFVGRGKVDELRATAAQLDADAVIVDEELSPAQQRNLEARFGRKVLDRTIVILDIFAQHAASKEGKAQVELAQLVYLLPRLRGWGDALSRQAGGIGTRGPGETQLEVDRRKLMRRINRLRADLREAAGARRLKTKERERREVPTVALVGYTNAGKSTLLNALTGSGVEVADKHFATLDTTARHRELPDSRDAVLTDTVGFVDKLPTQLVEAFKSTLEETARADLLVHVVDASHLEAERQVVAVDSVLDEIGAGEVPRLAALNKVDRADRAEVTGLQRTLGGVPVSASTGEGVEALLERIAEMLPDRRRTIEALVPYERGDLVAVAHREGEVHKEEHRPEGTFLVADLGPRASAKLAGYAEHDPWAEENDGDVAAG
jgi:GTP-binding protein HflX